MSIVHHSEIYVYIYNVEAARLVGLAWQNGRMQIFE